MKVNSSFCIFLISPNQFLFPILGYYCILRVAQPEMFCSVVRSTELFITNQTKVAWGLVHSRVVTFSVVVSRERFAALLNCTAEDPDKISI
jgi:hypothetical protein